MDQQSSEIEMWRLFAAVPLEEPVRRLIHDVQRELESENWPLRWVDPDRIHLTIRFFGETPTTAVDDLKRVLSGVARRSRATLYQTGQLGAFPSMATPQVIWIGLEGRLKSLEQTADLVEKSAKELGFRPEKRRFQGHVTVARVRNDAPTIEEFGAVAEHLTLPPIDLPAERLQLIRSILSPHAPSYSVLGEWQIGDGVARENPSLAPG